MNTLFRIQRISVELDGSPILHGIDLVLNNAEILIIEGASGCGKTALLRAIAVMDKGRMVQFDQAALLRKEWADHSLAP